MIKGIIFDFDGVIVESSDIKTEAFRELFQGYPQKVRAILDYHLLNGGISRYVKFRYIYEHILGHKLAKNKEIELGKVFSQIVFKKVLLAPLVAGTREFLKNNKHRYQFFIVSGTPQGELHKLIIAKLLQGYFVEIHGSPTEKIDIINNIMQKYSFKRDNVVYVGDSESDRLAAKKARLVFIERKADLDTKTKMDPWIIRDLTNLEEILQKIELENKNIRENRKEHSK